MTEDRGNPEPRRSTRPSAATIAAALLSLGAVAAGWVWGARVAGGSDSYCYVGQAAMWLDGSIRTPLQPDFPLTWSNAALSLAPTGFVPSPVVPGAIAPICPPGLSQLMAVGEALGGLPGAFTIVPLCGAIAVWSAFALGRRLAGSAAGVAGAALTLASPIFLHQLVQPMSDVPATAFWLAALATAGVPGRWTSLISGLAAALAVLVRPNLVPLAVPIAALVVTAAPPPATGTSRLRELAWFASGVAPGVLAVAVTNAWIYGSPLQSGYGDPSLLFGWHNVAPNLTRYPTWLLTTHTPWIVLGLAAPLALRRHAGGATKEERSPRALAVACVALTIVNFAIYVPYVVFEDWPYLRFVLPAVAVLIVLGAATTLQWLGAAGRRIGTGMSVVMCVVLALIYVRTADDRGVFNLHLSEAHFIDTGTWMRDHVPAGAVVLSVWQSGSIRLYGQRWTLAWDALAPDEFDEVVQGLTGEGRPPFLALESWEVPRFKARFAAASRLGQLDWPPRAQIGRDVFVYDFADRARFYKGASVRSERVWSTEEKAGGRRR